MAPKFINDTTSFCTECKSYYKRSYPHTCTVLDIADARTRFETWFGSNEVEVYQ